MLKKIKKIGALITIFILNFYNTCFADLVWYDENGKIHRADGGVKPPVLETNPVNYVLIGILALVVVVCAVFIIRRIIKKKKEKENDNK